MSQHFDSKACPPGPSERLRAAALGQGLLYVITGFWPVVSIDTFQFVTGPKRDLWLVKTVGSLLSVIGAVLALAGWRGRVTPEVRALGVGSALTLATVDVVYYRRGILRFVYLLDAVFELCITGCWFAAGPATSAPVASPSPQDAG